MTLKRTATGTTDGAFPKYFRTLFSLFSHLSHLFINGGKSWKVIGRTVYLCEQTNQILLLQAEPHVSTLWLVTVHFFFFFFSNTKLLPKPVQSEAKIYFPLSKAFSAVFFFLFFF